MVNAKNKLSNLKFVVKSENDFELDEKANLFLEILALDANQNQRQRKKELKINKTDVVKQAKLFNKIFNYIDIARC